MSHKSHASPYAIALFSKRQWGVVLCVFALLYLARVGLEYMRYATLPFDSPAEIHALVQAQYQKTKPHSKQSSRTKSRAQSSPKPYWVLKLQSNSHTFYTTSKEDLKPLVGRYVRLYGKIDKRHCSFSEYFRSCFFISFSIATLPSNHSWVYTHITAPLLASIHKQHTQNSPHASLFSTLFLATPLVKEWREMGNSLGLAHIFAISGFHLGIISFVLFVCITPLYRYFQRRYFSYRNARYDVGLIVLMVLFCYLVVLDFTPSFLRAFVMAVVAYVLYVSGLQILSFAMLGLVGLMCGVLFPSVLFHKGFILSMAGVLYILLFLRYAPLRSHSWLAVLLHIGLLHIAVFFSIAPVVHWFFPYFSLYQLISIPVSMAFVVLFPVAAILHLCHLGFVLDYWLDAVLSLQIPRIDIYTPWWFLALYIGASLWAIFARYGYYALCVLACGFYGYMLFVYYA